ncbi:hypothetical protein [Paenibacillus ginsengarvi]|uniref:Uncharacterized protein n=1 Tax=Paenibacillus ginsengarvi TaxID=400777 RepID=A0A3B0CVG2_9BACL|nr:hypothetical protein [Paenibacillus ginsengarvi]RKN86799.1 hypothetical protein D7M11_02245 [Paenibacillus ginsengarvi]
MIATENITGKLKEAAEQARKLVKLLEAKQNAEGISHLSIHEVSTALKLSRSLAKERIGLLIDFGIVRKNGLNAYKLIQTDLDLSPYGTLSELAKVITDMPNSTYEEQAAALGMTDKELEAAYGLLIYLLRN